MDKVIASRKPNGELIFTSPIAGRVVARNAAPGMLVQPASLPTPVTVADINTMWLIANVPEFDIPKIQLNQRINISITALPDEKFEGVVTSIGASIDPNTRRIPVRTELKDAKHQLRQQMLATYMIQTGAPIRSIAIPANGVVREGDGTMTLFVTKDEKIFTRRVVRTGQVQRGLIQILEGLTDGEKVATDGAIFLSNAIALQSR
jgi:cobalt-zinc-cadmium efflux system membrane fusion protein